MPFASAACAHRLTIDGMFDDVRLVSKSVSLTGTLNGGRAFQFTADNDSASAATAGVTRGIFRAANLHAHACRPRHARLYGAPLRGLKQIEKVLVFDEPAGFLSSLQIGRNGLLNLYPDCADLKAALEQQRFEARL